MQQHTGQHLISAIFDVSDMTISDLSPLNILFSKVIMPLRLGIWEKKSILLSWITPLLRIVYDLF